MRRSTCYSLILPPGVLISGALTACCLPVRHSIFNHSRAFNSVTATPLLNLMSRSRSLRSFTASHGTLSENSTYTLIQGGVERRLARTAFAGRVPSSILTRQHKGGITEHFVLMVARNRTFIRELLLDGILVAEKILDRGRVEDAVSDELDMGKRNAVELLRCVCSEVWLQLWNSTGGRAARRVEAITAHRT